MSAASVPLLKLADGANRSAASVGSAHRLRAILLRADQLEILMRDERLWRDVPEINKPLDALRKDLDREPVVQEDREKRDKLLLRRKGLRF